MGCYLTSDVWTNWLSSPSPPACLNLLLMCVFCQALEKNIPICGDPNFILKPHSVLPLTYFTWTRWVFFFREAAVSTSVWVIMSVVLHVSLPSWNMFTAVCVVQHLIHTSTIVVFFPWCWREAIIISVLFFFCFLAFPVNLPLIISNVFTDCEALCDLLLGKKVQ